MLGASAGLDRAQRDALDGLPGLPARDVALEHHVLPDERLVRRHSGREAAGRERASARELGADGFRSTGRSLVFFQSPGRPCSASALPAELQAPFATLMTVVEPREGRLPALHCVDRDGFARQPHSRPRPTASPSGRRRLVAGAAVSETPGRTVTVPATLRVQCVAVAEAPGLRERVRVGLVGLQNRRGGKRRLVGQDLVVRNVSLFVHVTVSPKAMVTLSGVKPALSDVDRLVAPRAQERWQGRPVRRRLLSISFSSSKTFRFAGHSV